MFYHNRKARSVGVYLVPILCLVARFIFKRNSPTWCIFNASKGITHCSSQSYFEKPNTHSSDVTSEASLELYFLSQDEVDEL